MKYLFIVLSAFAFIGCDDIKSDSCADGYQVYKLDGTFSIFCESASADKDGVYGRDCTRLEYVLSEKPSYEKIKEIRFAEGFYVKKKCEDIEPKSEDVSAAYNWIDNLAERNNTYETKEKGSSSSP